MTDFSIRDNLETLMGWGYVAIALLAAILILSYPIEYHPLPYTKGNGFIQFVSDYRIALGLLCPLVALGVGFKYYLDEEPFWLYTGLYVILGALTVALFSFYPCGMNWGCYETIGAFVVR